VRFNSNQRHQKSQLQGEENSSVGSTQSIGIALQRSVGQMMRGGPVSQVPPITWISRPVMILPQTRQ
jgi:hypothetical protein